MGILDDTALFAAIVQQGGFSHAAKSLGLSNGLVSRRIANLEAELGVTLIKRTTRQFQLTPEGEVFWMHARRIQQEMSSALSVIQSQGENPKGDIRVTAPIYFGKRFLMPIIEKFLANFDNVNVDLILTSRQLDPVKHNIDLLIRGFGFIDEGRPEDSSMQGKLLLAQKISVYVSQEYINQYGEPKSVDELDHHLCVGYVDKAKSSNLENWRYFVNGVRKSVEIPTRFRTNETESALMACVAGFGMLRYPAIFMEQISYGARMKLILPQYDWGDANIYALYAGQQALPKRTRMLLDFMGEQLRYLG